MKLFENVCVKDRLLSLKDVRLFADFGGKWDLKGLSEAEKAALIAEAEILREIPVPPLPASLYRQFGRVGNREWYETPYFERRRTMILLAYAEAIQQQGRFMDALIDYIWAILEESTWVIPAHNPGELCIRYGEDINNTDLFSAATGGNLALVLHLLGTRLDEALPENLLTRRIRREIHYRVILPISRYDMGWMYKFVNNWNPWIFSNTLFCLTVCEEDMAFRETLVERILHKLDNFVERYGDSGGCDEGPSYWQMAGGCFFDCLELLYDLSGGKLDYFGEPFVRYMGEYITKLHIDGNRFVAFADCPHVLAPHAAMYARFGHRTASDKLERFGLALVNRLPRPYLLTPGFHFHQVAYRFLKDTVYLQNAPTDVAYACDTGTYLDDVQVMTARESTCSDEGLFLAVKGGHNAESHNHNDVGSFVVYYNGAPFLIDAGVDTYSRLTFSAQRFTLWYMQSGYHNLPTVNGFDQLAERRYQATEVVCDPQQKRIAMELREAYPAEAGIRSFKREVQLADGAVTVTDTIALVDAGTVEEHLMLCARPELSQKGLITLPDAPVIHYDPALTASCEEISLLREDEIDKSKKLRGSLALNWGQDQLYRVTLSGQVKDEARFVLRITPTC